MFFLCVQDGHLTEKVTEMSNLRWLRLNRTNLPTLPEEIGKLSKLVSQRVFNHTCVYTHTNAQLLLYTERHSLLPLQEVLTVLHNNISGLHTANLPSIDSLRVSPSYQAR